MRCVSCAIHRFMRNVGIAGVNRNFAEPVSWEEDEVGAVQIATDLSAIERREGLACVVAKLNRGLLFKKHGIFYTKMERMVV